MSNGYASVFIRQNNAPRENNYIQLLLLAFCIGGIGALYHLSKPDDGLRTYQAIVHGAASPVAPSSTAGSLPLVQEAKKPVRPNHQFLTNVEVAEAKTPTVFTIVQLKGFNLIINYGDGAEEAVSGHTAAHVYQKGGDYRVTLKAAFNGQVEVFQVKKLTVAHAIEIDGIVPTVEMSGR